MYPVVQIVGHAGHVEPFICGSVLLEDVEEEASEGKITWCPGYGAFVAGDKKFESGNRDLRLAFLLVVFLPFLALNHTRRGN